MKISKRNGNKTVSFQESHSDGTDGNNGCDVQWQWNEV